MSPVLFEFFGRPLFSYTLFLAIAILGGIFILNHFLKRYDLKPAILFENLIPITIIGLIVGRFFHIIFRFTQYENAFTQWFNIFDGGIFLLGMILSICVYIYALLKKQNQEEFLWFDLLVPSTAWMLGWYHLGSLFSQKNIGIPTEKFWGIIFEGHEFPFSGISIHPIDGYFLVLCLIMFIITTPLLYVKKRLIGSFYFWIFWFGYSLIGILVAPYIMTPQYIIMGNNVTLLFYWIIVVISFLFILYYLIKTHALQNFKKSIVPDRSITRHRS